MKYNTESYIGKKDDPTLTPIEKYFLSKSDYDKWRKEKEEKALSEYYAKQIKIVKK